jgi:hypothetical protein
VGIVAPLIGAWLLVGVGPRWAFGTVGVIQALAAVPLFATPNLTVPRTAEGAFRASLPGVAVSLADGWSAVSYVIVWQIALFLSLGSSLSAFGGAVALAALVGALGGLLLGRHIDAGYGRRAVALAFSVVGLSIVLRALSLGAPWLAVAANAVSALAVCLFVPAQMTPIYNLAKQSPCALRFHIAAEGGWDVGFMCGCLLSALLIARGVPYSLVILVGLFGLAAQVPLLRSYYRRLEAW